MKLRAGTVTDEQIRDLHADLSKLGDAPYGVAECLVALRLTDDRVTDDQVHRARCVCASILRSRNELSPPKLALLAKVFAASDAGVYIYGSEVRTARALERVGLVTITDDGEAPMGGNADGERWSVELTNRARCAEILNARSLK